MLEALYGGQLAEARRNIQQLREQVETREQCAAKSSHESATLIRRLATCESGASGSTVADAGVQVDPPECQPKVDEREEEIHAAQQRISELEQLNEKLRARAEDLQKQVYVLKMSEEENKQAIERLELIVKNCTKDRTFDESRVANKGVFVLMSHVNKQLSELKQNLLSEQLLSDISEHYVQQ